MRGQGQRMRRSKGALGDTWLGEVSPMKGGGSYSRPLADIPDSQPLSFVGMRPTSPSASAGMKRRTPSPSAVRNPHAQVGLDRRFNARVHIIALQEYHTISIELMVRANTALGEEIYVVGEVCCARCACWTRSNCSHHMRSCSRRNSVCGTRSARSNCPPTRKYFRSGRRRCWLAMAQTACDARGRRCV